MALAAAIRLGGRGARAGGRALGDGKDDKDAGGRSEIGGFLEKILQSLKPISDILGLMLAIFGFVIFKILKGIRDGILSVIDWVKNLWNITKEKIGLMIDWLKALPSRIWEFMKALPGKIWEFMKSLPGKIWGFMKELPLKIWEFIKGLGLIIWDFLKMGFELIVEKLIEFKDAFVEKIIEFKEKLIEKLVEAGKRFKEFWDGLKIKIKELRDKFVAKINELKDKFKELIEALPERIWSFVQQLAGMIASAIGNIIGNLNPFRNREDVDDLIITKGKIFRTSPEDTIIATKNPESIGGSKIINFYGLTWPEAVEQMKREFGADAFNQGRF